MNYSKRVFPNKYKHNKSQADGECDFVDIASGDKYDAKLLFDEEQGRLIGSKNGNLESWLKLMMAETDEYKNCFPSVGLIKVQELSLYKIMKYRLMRIKPDENAIFFIPYPIVSDFRDSIFLQFATDILKAIYDELCNNSLIGNRKVYAIYPSTMEGMVLRDLATYYKENAPSPDLDKYFAYKTYPI